MTLPDFAVRHLAKQKVLTHTAINDGIVITPPERLMATYELARDVVALAYAIRRGTPVPSATAALTTNLRRILSFTAACVEDATRTILPTRSTLFRSGGIAAPTAHEAAVQIGWQALNNAHNECVWPDEVELLAELKVEYSNAFRTLPAVLPPADELPEDGTKMNAEDVPAQFREHGQPDGEVLSTNYIVGGESDWELSGKELSENYGEGKALTRRVKVDRQYVYLYSELKGLRKLKTERQAERENDPKRRK